MWVDESANGEPERSDDPFQWVNDFVQRTQQSGSFAYDEPTLSRIADRWQRIADRCQEGRQAAYPMTTVTGPGLDPASITMAAKVNDSGRAYLQSLTSVQRYCQAQADHCRKALGTYIENEHDNASWVKKFTPFPDEQRQGGIL
ncbi:PE domain-containing protein [Qaidamihabitans albus]|uniref:PE domain-containing protein n=1 Tax=Qaidamihabitans albus TaxID=2795733 RepID=UPI0018F12724|nr:PE domain-containing protein [Qaidamihabitans albus]